MFSVLVVLFHWGSSFKLQHPKPNVYASARSQQVNCLGFSANGYYKTLNVLWRKTKQSKNCFMYIFVYSISCKVVYYNNNILIEVKWVQKCSWALLYGNLAPARGLTALFIFYLSKANWYCFIIILYYKSSRSIPGLC